MRSMGKMLTKHPALLAILLAGGLLCARVGTAGETLTPHSAEYKVKISVLTGVLNTRLVATGESFTATHELRPVGVAKLLVDGEIIESARFVAVADGVVPQHYSSKNTFDDEPEQIELDFDWQGHSVSGTANGQAVLQDLADPVHDRISIQYEMMLDLLHDEIGGPYRLFEVDKIKTLRVKNIGEREVRTELGVYTAVGIQHQTAGSSRVTTLWCAPELGYLPVIIEQHKNGKRNLQATLQSYTPVTP